MKKSSLSLDHYIGGAGGGVKLLFDHFLMEDSAKKKFDREGGARLSSSLDLLIIITWRLFTIHVNYHVPTRRRQSCR